jgi:hypothetical protein
MTLPFVYVAGAPLTYSPESPTDVDEFGIDFSLVLSGYGDTITQTPTISVSPTGLSIFDIGYTATGLVTFYASGGTNSTNYQVTAEITTNLSPSGRTLNRTVILPVANR